MEGSSQPYSLRKRRALIVAPVLLMMLLGVASVYLGWQNSSLTSSSASLQSAGDSLRGNLSTLDSQLSVLESEHSQLVSNRTGSYNRVVELNSTVINSTRVLETLHTLSSETTIVSNQDVRIDACVNCASTPTPTALVVNFTAKYPGYVIVKIVTSPSVGEMLLDIESNPAMCSEPYVFCATAAFPNFLGPGESFLIPVLSGPVLVYLGNYNNYPVSASVTVVLYD